MHFYFNSFKQRALDKQGVRWDPQMGKLLKLARAHKRHPVRDSHKRNLARVFVERASRLLEGLSESDRRVGWLLSDCVNLLDAKTIEPPSSARS